MSNNVLGLKSSPKVEDRIKGNYIYCNDVTMKQFGKVVTNKAATQLTKLTDQSFNIHYFRESQ